MKKKIAFTPSCKTFRSDSSQAKLTQSPAQSALFLPFNGHAPAEPETSALRQKSASQTKFRSCAAHSYGFTLAETLIVLVILGVIAAITIPALVRNHIENANRTKLKKSMTVYDTAISKFTIENNLKSEGAIHQTVPIGDCTLTSQYFKSVEYSKDENNNDNLCRFKTADGTWFDISDILNLKVAFKEDDLDNDDNATTFTIPAVFDNNGNLRVNDINYDDEDKNVAKIYNYINGVKIEETKTNKKRGYATCYYDDAIDSEVCDHYDENGNITIKGTDCTENYISSCKFIHNYNHIYDLNENIIGEECNDSKTKCLYYNTYYKKGDITIKNHGSSCKGSDISSCSHNFYTIYDQYGNNIGFDCNKLGTNCLYYYKYDENGNKMTSGYKCTDLDMNDCAIKNYTTYEKKGDMTIQNNGSICKGSDISSCSHISYSTYDEYGNITGSSCNKAGTNCSTTYTITYDD